MIDDEQLYCCIRKEVRERGIYGHMSLDVAHEAFTLAAGRGYFDDRQILEAARNLRVWRECVEMDIDDMFIPQSPDFVKQIEQRSAITKAVSNAPQKIQEAVRLMLDEDMEMCDAAAQCGITHATFTRTLQRCGQLMGERVQIKKQQRQRQKRQVKQFRQAFLF